MTKIKLTNSLISVQHLRDNLSADNLVILDASMEPVGKVVAAEAETPAYIPGSLRFDFDHKICDHDTSLPHMMPTPAFFSDEMQEMGIDQDSAIVVYDKVGVYSSPRAWWMLRAMGHEQVAVLDGGLPAWIHAGFATVNQLKDRAGQRGNFISRPQVDAFVDSNYVMNALNDTAFRVMDARSNGRFKGVEPEPREGLKRGHMPNAVNIPFANVLAEGNVMKSPTSLRSIFEQYKNKKMVFSCGSGVTACILALAAEQAGYNDLSVYDASWSEWGLASSNLPVVTE